MPPATSSSSDHQYMDMAYPSRTIAFQAAGMITSIIENLMAHDEIKYTPAFIVYSLFSALIMHVYQMRSSVPSVVSASQERINVCMNALKEVSKVWLVAKMVHTLFESILGNKVLEERLQKAAGRRAHKTKKEGANAPPSSNANANGNGNAASATATAQAPQNATAMKRKFDEIDLTFSTGPPAPQVSYERSRPQTPTVTPSRDIGQHGGNDNGLGSPTLHDQYLPTGRSRGPSRMHSRMGTRANSPFNGFSIPATPPDLFLVTRNSPPISQSLWENFQPDQLFPDGTIPFSSPNQQHAVDPQLMPMGGQQGQNLGDNGMGWPQDMQGMMAGGMEQPESDRWSTRSRGNAPVVPTNLNVDDWFQFFGIHGDMSGVGINA